VVQTQSQSIAPGATATYTLRVQNDSTGANTLTVTGGGSVLNATIKYFVGTTDVTLQVTGAGYTTPTLAAGAQTDIRVTVTFGSSVSPFFSNTLVMTVASSGSNTTAIDKVSVVTRVGSTSGSTATITSVTVPLSSASALAASSEVVLRFAAPLDAATASDSSHYAVTVNGQRVEVYAAGYDAATMTVRLALALGTLNTRDSVQVAWSGLLDARGNPVTAGQVILVAK
jgi:hypothetical protein